MTQQPDNEPDLPCNLVKGGYNTKAFQNLPPKLPDPSGNFTLSVDQAPNLVNTSYSNPPENKDHWNQNKQPFNEGVGVGPATNAYVGNGYLGPGSPTNPNFAYPQPPIYPYSNNMPEKSHLKTRLLGGFGFLIFVLFALLVRFALQGRGDGLSGIFNRENSPSAANFTNGCNKWPNTKDNSHLTVNCGDGNYTLSYINEKHTITLPFQKFQMKDGSIEVTYKTEQLPLISAYGIFMRKTTKSMYIVEMYQSGNVYLFKHTLDPAKFTEIGKKNLGQKIAPNSSHKMRLEMIGSKAIVSIDDQEAINTTVDNSETGSTGMYFNLNTGELKTTASQMTITKK